MGLVALERFEHGPIGMKSRMCADVNATLQTIFAEASERWLLQPRTVTIPANASKVALARDIERVEVPVTDADTGTTLFDGNIAIAQYMPRYGAPRVYHVQSEYSSGGRFGGKMVNVLRVYPLANAPRRISFMARLLVPRVERDDDEKELRLKDTLDERLAAKKIKPATYHAAMRKIDERFQIPIPNDYWESVFLPLLRKQFTTWPHCPTYGNVEQIRTEAEAAMKLLKQLRPQAVRSVTTKISPYY